MTLGAHTHTQVYIDTESCIVSLLFLGLRSFEQRSWMSFLGSAAANHPVWGSLSQVLLLPQGSLFPSPFQAPPLLFLTFLKLLLPDVAVTWIYLHLSQRQSSSTFPPLLCSVTSLSVKIWKPHGILVRSFSTTLGAGVSHFDLGTS